jgi:predicted dehydrogenase
VLERNKQLSKEKYPAVIVYTSLEELLADENVELVVINTPNATHYEYAKKALEAGKHIIVEKPFTITTLEGGELVALAEKKGKKISVFHNRRFDSDFKTVKKIVEQDILGDVVEVEIHFDRYKQELSPKQHKEVPGPGTGVLYDLGSHILDQALSLFGMPDFVFGDIGIQRSISQVDDYFEVLMLYPHLRVRLKAGYLVREPLPSYILHGTLGSFIKTRADVQETLLQAGVQPIGDDWAIEPETERGFLHTEQNGQVIREHVATEKGNYMEYFEGVYQAIRKNGIPPVDGNDGLNVIKIIEAAYASNEQGSLVKIGDE